MTDAATSRRREARGTWVRLVVATCLVMISRNCWPLSRRRGQARTLTGMSGSRSRTKRRADARSSGAAGSSSTDEAEAVWVDGVPYIPDDEADRLIDEEAARWSGLMRRLAE
jgi:hypothetical protein